MQEVRVTIRSEQEVILLKKLLLKTSPQYGFTMSEEMAAIELLKKVNQHLKTHEFPRNTRPVPDLQIQTV